MGEVKTYQLRTPGGFSVACHAYGVSSQIYVKAPRPEESTADPDEPATWLEAYGRRHQATNPLSVHLEAVTKFAELYGMGEVMQDPTDVTARGYVFHTTGHTTKEKIMAKKNPDETVKADKPVKEKREPIPEGAIVDNKEITQELVNGWIDSYRVKGEEGKERMDWTGIVDAVKENHDVQLPNDNRHPVSTKVQRCFRAIVANGMEPVPAKPKKEKPAPEPEAEVEEAEAEVEEA